MRDLFTGGPRLEGSGSEKPAAVLEHLTSEGVSDTVTDMKVTSRAFQRDFARMKAKAAAGEAVYIVSADEQFIFQAVKPKTWQGALKGKAKITGNLFSTGLNWETSR